MKFACVTENFKKLLNITDKIVTKNLNLPVLNNILIKTDKNKIKISSTNLEIGIIGYLPAKIEEEGEITVPSKILTSFINNLTDDKINVSVNKKNILDIKSDNYKTSINGIDPKNFPIIPNIEKGIELNIKSKILKNALKSLLNIINFQEVRPELTGINLRLKGKLLKLVATDVARLGEKTIKIENNIESKSIIIPFKTCMEVFKILKDDDFNIKIIFDDSQILFEINDIKIISKLLNGQFPEYENIIPSHFKTTININKNNLLNAIKTISIFASRINDIKLITNVKKEKIELYCQNSEFGESSVIVACDKLEGEVFEIVYNYKYLLDGIDNIDSERVFIGIISDSDPILLRNEEGDYIYILMPLKII